MKISTSDNCENCSTTDFIEHFFYHCSLLNGFWQHVFHIAAKETDQSIPLTEQNALFGVAKSDYPKMDQATINTYNHLILIAKMSISKRRYGKLKNIFLIFDLEISLRKKWF